MDVMKAERGSSHRGDSAVLRLVTALAAVVLVCIGPWSSVASAQSKEAGVVKEWEDFNRGNFSNPTKIDNEWLPLKPGMQYVYEGATIEEGESVPHRIVFTVTDLTKVIDGIRSVVCWDQDFSDDELVEKEISFFAQDNDGTVWYMGEYPEEYEDGRFTAVPAWIAGAKDAKAGIMMKAEPREGTPSYSQGWATYADFTDRGLVDQTGQEATVPAGSYKDVLVIAESSKDETNAWQLKYYARGVGNIKVGWRGEDASQEAIKLDTRAHETRKDVFGHTPLAKQMSGAREQSIPTE
jgi:hypothetical protein